VFSVSGKAETRVDKIFSSNSLKGEVSHNSLFNLTISFARSKISLFAFHMVESDSLLAKSLLNLL
jgi:hypothetical protein